MYFIDIEDDDDDGYDAVYADDLIRNDRSIPARQDSVDAETVTATRNVYYGEGNGITSSIPRNGESKNIEVIKNTHNVYYET